MSPVIVVWVKLLNVAALANLEEDATRSINRRGWAFASEGGGLRIYYILLLLVVFFAQTALNTCMVNKNFMAILDWVQIITTLIFKSSITNANAAELSSAGACAKEIHWIQLRRCFAFIFRIAKTLILDGFIHLNLHLKYLKFRVVRSNFKKNVASRIWIFLKPFSIPSMHFNWNNFALQTTIILRIGQI